MLGHRVVGFVLNVQSTYSTTYRPTCAVLRSSVVFDVVGCFVIDVCLLVLRQAGSLLIDWRCVRSYTSSQLLTGYNGETYQ